MNEILNQLADIAAGKLTGAEAQAVMREARAISDQLFKAEDAAEKAMLYGIKPALPA